jgi:CBS domain-containing protein
MKDQSSDTFRAASSGTSIDASGRPNEAEPKDDFLQLMFFQGHRPNASSHPSRHPVAATGDYAPLRHSLAKPGVRYALPLAGKIAPIGLDAPAKEVMTDLRQVDAATIVGEVSIDEANRVMIARRVRALFVIDEARQVIGIVTSTDILGERPLQFAQQRGMRHGDVVVRDIMTPADRLEILDFHDVEAARVGDIVATLRLAGRQHALAVEAGDETPAARTTVRGIFSLTQIARQLGIPPHQTHDIARTFAEIQAAIA